MALEIKIAIDGPAAAGKSTIAKITAEKLGYTYIDTGAMYRALTHKALVHNINTRNGQELEKLLEETEIVLRPSINGQAVIVDGKDVTEDIRSQLVTASVSSVATHMGVRQLMVDKQRILAIGAGVVMDGRDIGTAVLPDAELKIFMTASVEERAMRRHIENEKRGFTTSLEQLKAEIAERDRADSEREVSPLRQAEDAVLIDTTSMSITDVAEKISELAEKRMNL
ncbi:MULTISPECIES: (d)CMP kinase [Sporosarcina]|uniref:Cytidylate kinase n=1 Tax=Sporosarcina psychrophila TaxID=1476 RepID=A0ABV2KAU4_SPOPS|nr:MULTISPECIES: (d)CMP kinase [Sporosarcina]AMQ06888.1 cytidylate kinase [Sporosarcina psychrophila]QNK86579.1 (d)CMP kinase [Sporosarcina sp. resist]